MLFAYVLDAELFWSFLRKIKLCLCMGVCFDGIFSDGGPVVVTIFLSNVHLPFMTFFDGDVNELFADLYLHLIPSTYPGYFFCVCMFVLVPCDDDIFVLGPINQSEPPLSRHLLYSVSQMIDIIGARASPK